MVEVSLRTYCEEIESLIADGAFDAAISHCQHILKSYPKYLSAYSLMGKAALEMGDLAAAADLFSRVLSIDPEDFIARVGMSIATDQDGSVDQAVWHMERAFELAPDNQAINDELRRLYGRRDGVEPDKIHLTRGALARLHARGSLYTQAINEMRQLLEVEPDRIDLQVALAETLWRAERRVEAAESSLTLLEKLPHCLKANLILGEIWSSSGREKEGTAHLERAQMIDPENEMAQALFGRRSPLPRATVSIGRMDYVAPAAPVEQETDWLQALIDEEPSPAATDEAIPDWLQAVAASAEVETSPTPEPGIPDSMPLPDWLQDVAATADEEAEAFASAPETTAPELSEDEMPDWLSRLTAEPTTTHAEALAPDEEAEEAPPDRPDWLAELALTEAEPIEATPPVSEESEVVPSDMPDWLAELAPTEMEPVEPLFPAGEEEEAAPELPDWLSELAPTAREPAATEDLGLAPAEIPDWLSELAPPEAISSDFPEFDVAPAEVPDWLAQAGQPEAEAPAEKPDEEEAEPTAPPLVAAETPDWLSELVEAAGATIEDEVVPVDQFAELEDEEVPDWLTDLSREQPPATVEPRAPEAMVQPEEAGEEALDAEAELMARLEDMSPEEAFAAWEALLTESEAVDEAPPVPAEAMPETPAPTVPTALEEPEAVIQPEEAREEAPDAEAELMARLEDMSPEEAFAAWEALLAESEAVEEAPPAPAEAVPATPTPPGPIVIEEPEKEALVYPEGAGGEVTEAEAELMARMEDMSPEEAFAAWEALLAESAEELPPAEAIAEAEQIEVAAEEIETAVIAEEPLPAEPMTEWEQATVPTVEEAIPAKVVGEPDQAWMTLAEDEGLEEIAAPPIPAAAPLITWEPLEEADLEEIAPPPAWEEVPIVEPASRLEAPEEEYLAEFEAPTAVEAEPEPALEEAAIKPPVGTAAEAAAPIPEIPPDLDEPMAEPEEPVEEEEDLAEPELREGPPWTAVEETTVTERPVAEVPTVAEQLEEPGDDQAHLELARRLWASEQLEEAHTAYKHLLSSPLRDEVITDLERIMAEGAPEEPLLRLLGDAYMRENRLQEALQIYRRALASL